MTASPRVHTSDGIRLAVREHGDRARPCIVCVHGYPDDRHVWDEVVPLLAERYHVVTYDVRGAGESDRPRRNDAYDLERLAADLERVMDEVSPERPVHLLAHDWGSIQAWQAVTNPRLRERIRSFTTISGPSLDHAGEWMRSKLRRPTPRGLRDLVSQLTHSGYIGFFQLPVIPELAWRTGIMRRVIRLLDPSARHITARTSDGVAGLALYRRNTSRRFRAPTPRATSVPVQVLAPTGDSFVGTPMQTEIDRWVEDLRVRHLRGGHWLPRSSPERIAHATEEFVRHLEGGEQSRELRRARTGVDRRGFADRLVVVTGAGSGIGRATAHAFAAEGAEIVAADVDEAAARLTAARLREQGAVAAGYGVDVATGSSVRELAERVREEHGVADIVINNAGIGMSGSFMDTTEADWQRVLDVNLWGVIHGCRAFAEQLIERGEGGRIVNVASAAAYLPVPGLPAYASSKAAVLALSERLRGELSAHGIGVTAVCPGVVSSGITDTTTFVGSSPEQQRRKRERAGRLYRRRAFTSESAAAEILRAVRRDRAVAPVTPEARAGLLLSRLTPGLLRTVTRARG
ncbi:NAD(P)-dependent dehydrogenase (short-subunit alcohol dehydrogenase family)/pimeloyl-ACP methyl ester carboxylesterase [Actinopolyspora lacussalsi]|nr:NAD(P)-dependent dehydrogenase (short-subunit alcohol dehydrogenase family)/pimeloyl-ACP methyl ester carboxylesterase [Actinopolyspora lacussalsi]